MGKKSLIFMLLALVLTVPAFAGNRIFFTEYGISYASPLEPSNMENNTTGTYDTAAFDIKAGVNILKWAGVYGLTGFQMFVDRTGTQQHYSFFPIGIGVRANIFPEWPVYPDFIFEYGRAFANRHTRWTVPAPAPYYTAVVTNDGPWTADYYSFGFGVNWNITYVSVISLRFERPSFSNTDSSGGEIHIAKLGLAWKLFY
ncbi:MAG: hypothetical protein LLG37_06785 [Spirochaetia bacterium]|nr:hypothetical protein [Spirochaetia bacterium]